MSQVLIKNGNCVSSGLVFKADLLIENGRIAMLADKIQASAEREIDAGGLFVLPGGIDVHVHMPWPMGDHISLDDIPAGTRAAAFGGITTVIDFAIPDEGETLRQTLEKKMAEAQHNAWVDYSFHINIRGDVSARLSEIPTLVKEGFPSFKAFMAYEGFQQSDADLLKILEAVGRAGGVLSVHAEDGSLADAITEKLVAEGKIAPYYYPQARPEICETSAIHRILSYQGVTGTRLHIHHVSSDAGARLIAKARRQGRPVTGETCPPYLTLNNKEFEEDPTRAAWMICSPSIKSPADQESLWKHLASGSLSILATDHCPYSRKQKEEHLEDFTQIPGGIGGVELCLPLIYSEGVIKGKLAPERFVEVWAAEPARAFGLYPRKGCIAVGSDADLVILDPNRRCTIRAANLHMNSDCLPYEGWQVQGLPVYTLLRGRVLVEEGRLVPQQPFGELLRRRLPPL